MAQVIEKVSQILENLSTIYHGWQVRRSMEALADVSDRSLKDIGLTREDIRSALAMPYTSDAAQYLERQAQAHRQGVVRQDDVAAPALVPCLEETSRKTARAA